MKPGTIIKLPNGRIGTVVFNGLCGVGIVWGKRIVSAEDFEGTAGDVLESSPEAIDRGKAKHLFPQAYLREEFPAADLPCVGNDFEIVSEGIDL